MGYYHDNDRPDSPITANPVYTEQALKSALGNLAQKMGIQLDISSLNLPFEPGPSQPAKKSLKKNNRSFATDPPSLPHNTNNGAGLQTELLAPLSLAEPTSLQPATKKKLGKKERSQQQSKADSKPHSKALTAPLKGRIAKHDNVSTKLLRAAASTVIGAMDFNAEMAVRKDQQQHSSGKKNQRTHKAKPFEPKVVCKYWMEGLCTKGEACTFSHAVKPRRTFEEARQSEPCKYILVGTCLRGEQCLYSHDLSKVPCRFYHLKHECTAGPSCRFSHDPISESAREKLLASIEVKDQKFDADSTAPSAHTEATPQNPTPPNPAFSTNLKPADARPTDPRIKGNYLGLAGPSAH